MSLKDEGFRFMVSKDRKQAGWFLLPDDRFNEWVDCTDMIDDEFYNFMTTKEKK